MKRRSFITSAAVGAVVLAGCSGGGDGLDDDSGNSTTDTGSTAESDLLPPSERSVVDFETESLTAVVVGGTLDTDDGLEAGIRLEEPATGESPATVVTAVHNTRSYEQTFQPRRLLAFGDPAIGRSEEGNIVYLAPVADHPLAETPPAYERDDDGRWRLEAVDEDWFPETVTVAGEETIVGRHYLLGSPRRGEPPVDVGRYHFRQQDSGFTIVVWETDAPGPEGESRFSDGNVPALPDSVETGPTAWYHEATPSTAVFLRPDSESVTAPGTLSFELVNHSHESVSGNPQYWRLYKLEDDKWFPIAPWVHTLPLAHLGPGSIDETDLSLSHGEATDRNGVRTVGHLGGGRYAYAVGYDQDGETHAAAFDLEAPDLEVGLESDATVTDDGETVVVELSNYEDARQPATFTLTLADVDIEGVDERLLPEQLPRRPFRGFRNVLPLFGDGVETVRVKTDRRTARGRFDYEEGQRRTVAYEGRTFEATGELEE